MRLLHKGESLCCFRDSASVTYGGMLPSDLTLSALRFILSAESGQSCKQDCETVGFCNSLNIDGRARRMPCNDLYLCAIRRMCQTVEASNRWGRTNVTKKSCSKRLHCSEKVVPLHHGSGRKTQMGSRMKLDFVAQLVEQLTLNQWVEGSSPSEVTADHSFK